MTPTTYLALLRGINVGGKNKLPMKDLARFFVDAGCRDVRTFIQSGNVVLTFDGDATPLPGIISARIADGFGIKIPVQLRTAADIARIVASNPFLAAGDDPETLHVSFLADPVDPDRIATLDPDRSTPDRFVVAGQVIYMHMPDGMADSKLTNAYFDSKLKTVSTVRNWRTVTKLLAMMS